MILKKIKTNRIDSVFRTKPKSKITYIFLAFYGVAIAALLLSTIDNVPARELLESIKWLYLAFSVVNVIIHCRRFSKKILVIAGILLSYIIFFGVVFVNDIVASETRQYLIQMLIYFGLLYLTYLQVKRFNCFIEFVKTTYISFSAPLLLAYFTHLHDTTFNPLYFIKVIVFDLRRRSTFGFIQQNIVGAVCFLTFFVSLVWFYCLTKKQGKQRSLNLFSIYMIVADLVIWLMFQSTSSRASLTSFFLLLFFFLFFEYIAKNKKAFFVCSLVGFIGIVAVVLIFGNQIWSASNRSANIQMNIQWIEVIGNKWTGMGFVENSAFQYTWVDGVGSSAFGVKTTSLDIYYVYLYCTTGILGCIMVGTIITCMAIWIFKRRKEPYGALMISMYICLMYYAIWESVIFAFRFWPFFIVFIILWCFIDGTAQKDLKHTKIRKYKPKKNS